MRGVSFDIFSTIDWRLIEDVSVPLLLSGNVRVAALGAGCIGCCAVFCKALPVIRRFLKALTSIAARVELLSG